MSLRHSSVFLVILLLTACAGQPRSIKPVVATAQPEVPTTSSMSVSEEAAKTPVSLADEAPKPFDLTRPEIVAFIDAVSTQHAIPADELRALLGQGLFQPKIIVAMNRPAERVLAWWEYKDRLVSPERVARGREFWNTHRDRLSA
ncbi:MAG: hypothetical protein RLZZ33_419, partial [Pseudomonadota bacterium]